MSCDKVTPGSLREVAGSWRDTADKWWEPHDAHSSGELMVTACRAEADLLESAADLIESQARALAELRTKLATSEDLSRRRAALVDTMQAERDTALARLAEAEDVLRFYTRERDAGQRAAGYLAARAAEKETT